MKTNFRGASVAVVLGAACIGLWAVHAGASHNFAFAGPGMPIVDNVDTEDLAATAAKLKRWEFMLVIAPLRIPNGTGGPVNPVAVF